METSEQEKLLESVAKILLDLRIEYIITGGMAVCVWGRPRATFDVDIIVKIIESKVIPLTRAFKKISKAGYADEDMAKEAIKNKGEFNFIHPQTGLKVDFWAKRYSFERFQRAVVKKIDGQKIIFISPEDLILSKLIWYKEGQGAKQLEDIKSILEISKPDLNYIKKWAKKNSTIKIFNQTLSTFTLY